MQSSVRTQPVLILTAAVFVTADALALTLAPAVRARSGNAPLDWSHWLGWLVWMGFMILAARQVRGRLPRSDPFLLPIVGLLSGWGLLTIWRLSPYLGMRQTIWLGIAGAVFILGLRLPSDLAFLWRYKYMWLTSGLVLTALTLVFGTNPLGGGPRLWLGCCGLYLQPAEPLKILLILYLAAYLANPSLAASAQAARQVAAGAAPRVLTPTIVMTGLALALMAAQRDLGTASILLFVYAAVVYVATGRKRVLLACTLGIVVAALGGYALFDVVRIRVDAWLNPWLDPSGRSYQIVQSLLAMANGGLVGRGPGLGSPWLVPVAHSDFIFAAIMEENGLVGALGLLALLALLTARGLRAALRARGDYARILASGLTAYLVAQSIVIVGGNLRLLPLTGVTLPFISYGGSSLLVSFLALLLLLHVSQTDEEVIPQPLPELTYPFQLGGFLLAGLVGAALLSGWWAVVRGPELLSRTDNLRRSLADRSVRRGAILDRNNVVLAESRGEAGRYQRVYPFASLGPVIGYTHPVFGQSGLEATLDPYLRGLQGNPALFLWWQHLLYGQPPPGLDVRLTLDSDLQKTADELLGEWRGAAVLLHAKTGEILLMASHPTFDANQLDDMGMQWQADPASPLLNRATQGLYPARAAIMQLFPELPAGLALFTPPAIQLPTASGQNTDADLHVTPLQAALVAAAFTNGNQRPAPVLVLAVNTPLAAWVLLPSEGKPAAVSTSISAQSLAVNELPFWQSVVSSPDEKVTWYLGGTLPQWKGIPLGLAVLLEGAAPSAAEAIGSGILEAATQSEK